MARKIKESHQNQKNIIHNNNIPQENEYNSENKYFLSKMKDVYGQKGNYHLNEYNIEYSPSISALGRISNKNNNRIKIYKHINDNISNKKRGKSSYMPNDISNEEINNKKENNLYHKNNNNNNNNKIVENSNSFLNDMANISNNNLNNKDDEKNKTDKLYYAFDNNNNNNFQTNIINYFMSCKFLFTMNYNEIEEYLNSLWKKLGVKLDYINIFNFQKNHFISEEEKIDFIILEIENIKKFEDILIKLSKEIESREKCILNIKNLSEEMKKIEQNENNININDLNNKKIMNSFLNSIISYRVHSLKVVEYYLLFKEKILQCNYRNKFDEELIKKKCGLTKNGINYIIKMKNDMNFLTKLKLYSNKNIENIFESFKGDPFLRSLYNIVPASREYKQRIKYCEYFIMQESLYDKSISKKNLLNNISNNKLNEINENNRNYQKKKLEPISNININKYKTENNPKEIDFSINNKNDINKKKLESNIKINEKEEANKKISEFNYKENLNINIKKTKLNVNCEKEITKENNDKITEKNILRNSLTLSKTIKKKNESHVSTPESNKLNKNEKNINKIKTYNTSYYCGSLSDFIFIYNNYYQRIPLEQKRIFNIKSNPLEYFYHNYYPKIIICSDNKLSLTKGICIYSILLNYENKPNKIIIEHLSSYVQDEMENIFKIIFEFLKNNNILSNTSNNVSNEIYIDLYFYLEKEKFHINTQIRDFIKNELKFKWVKLENISKDIRYQKMKHLFNTNNNVILNSEIDDNNVLNQSIIGKKALKEMNENTDDIFEDNLICNFLIKNKSIIKYINKSQIKEEKENNLIFNNIKYINSFNIIYLIKKIPEDCIYSEYIENNTYNFFNMNEHFDIEEILNNNDNISLNDILQNNSFLTSDLKQLTDFFNNKYNKNYIKEILIYIY